MFTRRLKIYSTATIAVSVLVFVYRRGAVTLSELSPDRKRPLRLSFSGERRVREGGGRKGGRGEGK